MKYKAVMFDLDGTLLDTIDDLAESMNSVLAKLGYPQHSVDKYRHFVGDGMVKLAQRVLPDADEDVVSTCLEAMREEYGRRWDLKTLPYPGIVQMLDELKERGLILTVFSNKPDGFTKMVVSHYFGDERFRVVMGAKHFPTKPDPSGALHISEQVGVTPEEFLYVGDTDTDMRTAVAAGMFPVGVAWGFRTEQELTQAGAELIVRKPQELSDALG
ncbi:MAG: HAD family hydrolase [Chitinispirillaceae bacterium]